MAVAVIFAVATRETSHKPNQVKPPDAKKLGIVDAVVQMFNYCLRIVKVFQPFSKCFGVIISVDIPFFNRLEVFIVAGKGIVFPVTTVGENLFVGKNAGYIVGSANCDDMNENFAVILQERCQLLESLG
ncbi:hypothetical protein [Microcoleus vaginatus]|uniref:hypothetical protein n=1 Tax=Microcoleus vaginatus TaxID=119532 RepID=UPI00403F5B42